MFIFDITPRRSNSDPTRIKIAIVRGLEPPPHSEDVLGGNFTGKKQDLFEPVNMRNCGKLNFRKHRDIKDSDECVTLKAYENTYEILKFSEKFDNMDKMETTSSESKVKREGSGKWLVPLWFSRPKQG